MVLTPLISVVKYGKGFNGICSADSVDQFDRTIPKLLDPKIVMRYSNKYQAKEFRVLKAEE